MRVRALFSILFIGVVAMAGCAEATDDGEEGDVDRSEEALERGRSNSEGFVDIPEMSASQRRQIVARYAHIQHPGVRHELFAEAVLFYHTNYQRIQSKDFMGIVDFAKHSREKRFFVLDMRGGPMTAHVVAHGGGSDPNDDGYATRFSNVSGSHQSSIGFYVTAETYQGRNGESMRLDGLSSTTSNVRDRAIVIHSAAYVSDSRERQGMSQGCFAFADNDRAWVMRRLKEGSIIYAWN